MSLTHVTDPVSRRVARYTVFGVRFASALECPDLPVVSGSVDAEVRLGPVPERLGSGRTPKGSFAEADSGRFLLSVAGVARFLAIDGKEITVQPDEGANESEILLYLLGPVMGALTNQRGGLALHAGAVSTPRGTVLLAGHSGAGKSTLLAAFLSRGYPLVADDLATIGLDESGRPLVHPGYPQLKLWPDAVRRLGWSRFPMRPLRRNAAKCALNVGEKFMALPQPLRRVYRLVPREASEVVLAPLLDGARFEVLRDLTYGERYLDAMGLRASHFRLAGAVAASASIRITDVRRPSDLSRLDELVERIERDLEL